MCRPSASVARSRRSRRRPSRATAPARVRPTISSLFPNLRELMQRTLVVVICLAAATAHAEDRGAAEQMFRIGAEAYKAKRYEAAVENFEGAYQQFKAPEIAFSAAQAH